MGKAVELREVEIAALKPYERNAKKHPERQLKQIAKSIERLGFLSPCLIDQEMNVIAGHGRIMAAEKLGRKSVPCVFVEGLTDAERKAYILADNRLQEMGDWDMNTVEMELQELNSADFDVDFLGFDVDIGQMEDLTESEEQEGDPVDTDEKGKPWTTRGVKCDMKLNVSSRMKSGHRYTSMYAVSKEGMTLEEIKNSKMRENQMAEELSTYLLEFMGPNMPKAGWAMITTGRRRHREGYHFATEVTRRTAEKIGLKFYEGAINCANADRLKPKLELITEPEEKNLILFDDVITTGTTMSKTVDMLQNKGYTVMTVIGIRNQ